MARRFNGRQRHAQAVRARRFTPLRRAVKIPVWGDLSLRLSANYKSEYLLEVLEPMDARYDNTVDSQVFVDFTFNYFISDRLKLTFEALNLTDEVYYTYVNSPRYNAQYEQYGSTYKLGLTFMSF